MNYRTLKLSSLILGTACMHPLAFSEPMIAAHFGGDYGDTQNSALRNVVQTESGDFDGDGTADDSRAFLPIGVDVPKFLEFLPGLPERNNRFFGGGQVVNFNSATSPAFGLLRYNGTSDYFQITNAAGTAEMGISFSVFVIKEDFLNGSTVDNLKFSNKEDGITGEIGFSGTPLIGEGDVPLGIRRARILVKSGEKWYVSRSTWGSKVSDIVLNPYLEVWHEYDPATQMFVYEVSIEETIPVTPAVAGSELSDIQAVGILSQNTRFDGLVVHAVWQQIYSFRVELDPDPPASLGEWMEDPVIGPVFALTGGWALWYRDAGTEFIGAIDESYRNPDGTGWLWHQNEGWIHFTSGSVTGGGVFAWSVNSGWIYVWDDLGTGFYDYGTGTMVPWL